MTRKTPVIVIFILCLCIQNYPSEKKFRWPLNINNGYSSSFQEYRPGHFHGGIDIRTLQRTGYPVHAVMSGHIFKIRNVKRGSGRGIYIQHRNGLKSIYFHLEKFAPPVEAILKRLQRSTKKKYTGNYTLQKPIYVKQGDLIGYSGETGSGYPHLHLEVRDEENARVNPFPMIQFPERDSNYPVIRKLVLRPVGKGTVNGKYGESVVQIRRTGDYRYAAEEIIYAAGPFEMVIHSWDVSDTGKRVAPSKIELFQNGEQRFGIGFTRFTYNDNNQLGFVYDMHYSSSSSYFFNLFSQTGFDMCRDSVSVREFFGLLKPGDNEIKLRISDNFNNTSTAGISVHRMEEPLIKTSPPQNRKSGMFIRITEFAPGPSTLLIATLHNNKGDEVFRKELPVRETMTFSKIPIPDQHKDEYFRLEFELYVNDKKIKSLTNSYNNYDLGEITDIPIDTFINRDTVSIRINDQRIGANNIVMELKQGRERRTVFPETDAEGLFFRFKPLNSDPGASLNFSVYNNMKLCAQVMKTIHLVRVRDGDKQRIQLDELELSIGKTSVREDKALLIDTVEYGSEYPVLSSQFRIYPYTFPFLDRVTVKISRPVIRPKQAGIFRYSLKSGKWYYTGTSIKKEKGTFTTRTLNGGIFCLMRDVFKPEIRYKRPGYLNKNNIHRFSIMITDKGKGVDDETIKTVLNGVSVNSEYDPDWKKLKINGMGTRVKKGWNTLKVSLKDRGGNPAERSIRFRVGGTD